MENKLGWRLLTAVAPIAWGSTYFVVKHFLPAGHPLWGAAIRALPAGIILLLIARTLPRGSWWWKSLVLAILNVSVFFVLVYLAGQLLPTSVAAIIMAFGTVAIMLVAWPLLGERPTLLLVVGGAIGVFGVVLMLSSGQGAVSGWGIAVSVTAMLMNAFGSVLAKKWTASGEVSIVAMTSWQLVLGGLMLLPVAAVSEGAPPELTLTSLLGFAYLTLAATAVATLVWFLGLSKLPAAEVGVIGLLNPVTGVVLGVLLAGEVFGIPQGIGVALVCAGILLSQRRRGRREIAPDAIPVDTDTDTGVPAGRA